MIDKFTSISTVFPPTEDEKLLKSSVIRSFKDWEQQETFRKIELAEESFDAVKQDLNKSFISKLLRSPLQGEKVKDWRK
jgi:hypothetical protein